MQNKQATYMNKNANIHVHTHLLTAHVHSLTNTNIQFHACMIVNTDVNTNILRESPSTHMMPHNKICIVLSPCT